MAGSQPDGLLAAAGIDGPTAVLPGCASAKAFPGEPACPPDYIFDVYAFAAALDAAVAAGASTLLCLKPPTELLELIARLPGDVESGLLSTLRLALYGSFNVRQLAPHGAQTNAAAATLLNCDTTPFASVVLYESFGGTAERVTNINPTSCPRLFEAAGAATDAQLPGALGTAMRLWDEDVLRDCDESCAAAEAGQAAGDPLATQAWGRNNSCRIAVRANFGRQFVAADPVLAAVLDNPDAAAFLQPVAVDFAVMPYPPTTVLPAAPPGHKLWKYAGVPWDTVCTQLARVRWF